MADTQLKEQILKATFKRIGYLNDRNASVIEIGIEFDHLDKDVFFDAVVELIKENLLFDRGRGYVSFTPEGWDKARILMEPAPVMNQNTINIGHAVNSPIQQGIHAHQEQKITYHLPSAEDLSLLVDLLRKNLSDLQLSAEGERKTKAQLATIEAQLMDEPNQTIIKEAGRTIKNITEGAIGSLLATAAQPGVWTAIQSVLASF